ncbi:dihydrofolate reductase [Candidatus Woesearchaeota archaeon]|nr:dihydrofolate reductase [Candidatus Woesearchaeota archaeon]
MSALPSIALIVAMRKDHLIGCDGGIPWKVPGEQKLFRDVTMGSVVIMGKETWLSIPQKYRPLQGRDNVVVSSTLKEAPGAMRATSVNEALAIARSYNKPIFFIGGAGIYAAAIDHVDHMHISWIGYDGPLGSKKTYFPQFSKEEWVTESTMQYEHFTYEVFVRKNL